MKTSCLGLNTQHFLIIVLKLSFQCYLKFRCQGECLAPTSQLAGIWEMDEMDVEARSLCLVYDLPLSYTPNPLKPHFTVV